MRRPLPLASFIFLAAAIAGCDRGAGSQGEASTRPAATNPVAAEESAGGESTLTIGGKSYAFGPARLIVDEPAGGEAAGVLAVVFSEGASPEGARDGYYLEMTVDVPDASRLDGASWQYASKSNDRADDTLSAITVDGGARQLQPKDVTVTFGEVSADVVEVRLNGFFNVFSGRDGAVSSGVVPVEATLMAKRRASR